jgi:hypothetical protein
MLFAFKFNYEPSYAKDTKYSFTKKVFKKGYCPIHNDVLIKKGLIFKQHNECWRCLQKFNEETKLFYIKRQIEEIQEEQLLEEQIKEKEIKKEQIKEEEIKEEQLPEEQITEEQITEEQIQEEQIIEEQIQEEQITEEQIQEEQLPEQQITEEQIQEEQIIEEQIIEEQIIEEQIQEEQIIEEQIQEKNHNEYKKILDILFRFHYERGGETGHLYKSFQCKLCFALNLNYGKVNIITRENFKVARLGHSNQTGPKHILNILPVCSTCHSNWSINNRIKSGRSRHLYRGIMDHMRWVEQHKLVSLDEISFIHNYDIDKLFPIV